MWQAGLLSIQTPFLRCKMLVGLCPIPFILHRSDAGCAFFQNASIYILENALAGGTGFSSTNRPENGLVEHLDFTTVCLTNQSVDLLSIVGAAVRHGEQDALDFQLWVDLPMHLVDGLQKLFQTFRGKVLCLYGYQSSVCRRQRVNGQHPKGGSAVQQNIISAKL